MAKKKTQKLTIDDLGAMVQRGFEEIRSEMATKSDLAQFRDEVNQRFDQMKVITMSHTNRIERVEDKVERIETKLVSKR